MNWHPLDGNMIAADRHYAMGDDPQEGGRSKCCEGGHLEYSAAEVCLCSPDVMCAACEEEPLRCNECGEVAA